MSAEAAASPWFEQWELIQEPGQHGDHLERRPHQTQPNIVFFENASAGVPAEQRVLHEGQ